MYIGILELDGVMPENPIIGNDMDAVIKEMNELPEMAEFDIEKDRAVIYYITPESCEINPYERKKTGKAMVAARYQYRGYEEDTYYWEDYNRETIEVS